MNELIRAIQENDSRRIKLIKRTPFKFVNFADNIDQDLISPALFEKYMLPWYRTSTAVLHDAGKICISHWDGKVKALIRYARDTGLDALECVPPSPMGNVTLEELHYAMKGMVLFDGIPATYFLNLVSKQELIDFTNKILSIFSPKII